MAALEALNEKPIKHHRGTQLKLETFVSTKPFGADTLGCCIKVPKTKSVKRSGSHNGRIILGLELEDQGATTGRALMSVCCRCSTWESSPSANLPDG